MEYIWTYILSTLPLVELRLAIPLAYFKYKMGIIEASLIGILGGVTIAYAMLTLLPIVVKWADQHWPWFHRFIQKVLQHTRKKHSHKFTVISEVALIIFVAVPIPGSGVFSGSILAYLFNLPKKQSLIALSLGATGAAIIVALLTLSGGGIWELINEAASVVPL